MRLYFFHANTGNRQNLKKDIEERTETKSPE